jgi:hypothetical protein
VNGRLVAGGIVIAAAAFGAALWYSQVYGYYARIAATAPEAQVRLVSVATGAPEGIAADGFEGIDADSSPLKFRACFTVPLSLATLSETYVLAEKPVPLIAPGWFSCFDAGRIGAALETGEALAFLSEPDIHPGVDRIVAVFADGHAYAWQQLNAEGLAE